MFNIEAINSMEPTNKILVVEDEITNAILLKRILSKAGYDVEIAHNGKEALSIIKYDKFDAILTDWMMPQMDGIELIRQIREQIVPNPLIIMITALVSDNARSYALESGADDYIAKPIEIDELLNRLNDALARKFHKIPIQKPDLITLNSDKKPKFIGVVIATSTGGPPTIVKIFKRMPKTNKAAYFIVQHGPSWMLETFAQRLQNETELKVHIATNGMFSEPDNIYIAPGERHMVIDKSSYQIFLDDGPKENFVRPSADPLFRTAAESFGKYCIGLILSGLGSDGVMGASAIAASNGLILVQDPKTALAPTMPEAVINSGIKHKVIQLDNLSEALIKNIDELHKQLELDKSQIPTVQIQ